VQTPEEIYDLILNLTMPILPESIPSVSDEEFHQWEDKVQVYYERVAELRRQIHEAIPEDAPLWVQGAVYRAWRGEVSEADHWRAEVKRRRRLLNK
jgi:hypothetical protein